MFALDAGSIISFINNISSGIIIVSSELEIKYINTAALKTLYLEREKCVDKKIIDIIPDTLLIESIKDTLNDNISLARLVTNLKLKNTSEIIIGFTTSPYSPDNISVSGVVINFRDISSEVALENRLKFSEHKYKLLIQNLQGPVILLNYNDLSIIEYNKAAFSKIKGLSNHSSSLNFIDAVNFSSRFGLKEYLNKIKNGFSGPGSVEIETHDINGDLRILELTSVLLEIGEEKFIQILGFDITEKVELSRSLAQSFHQLKETQQTLIRAERLAAAGELSAGISHEIKNRFQVIANAVSYIKTKIDMTNDALKVNIMYIENEVNRGVNLINELMEFSKPHPPNKKKVSLIALLSNSIPLIEKQLQKKRIMITENYSDLPDILIDYNLIQQVIINILKNAEQAMNDSGELTVKIYVQKSEQIRIINYGVVKKNKYNEYAVIEISDTGAGIEENNLSRIFTPFYTSKGPNEGTGLGLSVSHTIIEQHEGFIDVKSEFGKGSNFFIYLPLI